MALTYQQAKDEIQKVGGRARIFSCVCVKKDGTERKFVAKLTRFVGLGKSRGKLPYDPEEKGVIPIFDVQLYNQYRRNGKDRHSAAKASFRMLNVAGIQSINGAEI